MTLIEKKKELDVAHESLVAAEKLLKAAHSLLEKSATSEACPVVEAPVVSVAAVPEATPSPPNKTSAKGAVVTGVFEGLSFVANNGDRHAVPSNYAAKSELVYGDTIKMEQGPDPSSKAIFKAIARVKRSRLSATLKKEADKWVAVTEKQTYTVFSEAVEHAGLSEGASITILVPEGRLDVPFAAIEKTPPAPKSEEKKNQTPEKSRPQPAKKKPVPPKKKVELTAKPKVERKPRTQVSAPAAKPEERTNASDDPGRTLEPDDLR